MNEENLKELKNWLLKLQSLIKNFDGAPGIFIYLERVKNIGKEKYREMGSHHKQV